MRVNHRLKLRNILIRNYLRLRIAVPRKIGAVRCCNQQECKTRNRTAMQFDQSNKTQHRFAILYL
jgi:hypothetical protein